MINKLIEYSLKNKYIIIIASVILLVWGTRTALNMDVDVLPDLTAPTVVVMTDAHDMASEEVERLVTYPIESAVNGATGVRRVRSASAHGYSFVWVDFDWGTDVFKARQIVSEKLITVSSQMPQGIGQPILAPQTSVMGEIFFIGLQADSTNLMKLRTIADWNLKPLILATEGVSQVTVIGGDKKEYHILADPVKMLHFKVSLNELIEACKFLSENSTGGIIREYGNEYVIRGIARSNDLDDFANTLIKSDKGKSVRIEDVAEIKIGSSVKTGYASLNGTPAVIISISKQPNANTLNVTKNIEENLIKLQETLPPDVQMDTKIFRQADFIETSVRNVQNALIEGGVFVIIILFLFLGSFRTTIISLLAIPLSLLGAVIVLKLLNLNINTMSLGGMAIAIGSLVDDAIIDVENVYKRLKENRFKADGEKRSSFTVVFEASKEIRASVFNATLIIIVAFMPLFFLSGMEGRMLKPLGISFIVSLAVSLLVAMTLTPVLARFMLSGEKYLNRKQRDTLITKKLKVWYTSSLGWALKHKRLFLFSTVGLFLASLLVFITLGRSFLPEFNEGALTLSVVTKPGTSLEESNNLGTLVENELLKIPEVLSTARRTGRGELDEHSQTTNSAEIDVNFELDDRSRIDFLKDVRETLAGIPGIAFTVGQPLGHRIDHMLSGTRANIAIKLFGPDLNKLFKYANEIKANIIDIKGLADVNTDQKSEIPQIQILAHREMLANYGITMKEFNQFIETAFPGKKTTDIYEDQRSFDLILRFNDDYTQTLEGIKSALIDTEDGRKVPLEKVAEIKSVTGPGSISRENVKRKIVISANVSGEDLRSVVNEIQRRVNENINLPEGYRIDYGGQFESEAKASRILMLTSILAVIVIYLLLYQEFKNFRLAGIILMNLPLALIGGVFAVALGSGVLSIPAIIGFITLFGIATRNGILLISHYQHLHNQGTPLKETLIQGSLDRLLPILMTALTAALALIPLAVQGDLPGNEIQSPMAKVILGGLLSSTLLNIFIVPIVYSILSGRGMLNTKNERIK